MDEEMVVLATALNDGLDSLPYWKNDAFCKLWSNNRLTTRVGSKKLDGVDRINALLLWATIEHKSQLLIGMPDTLQHRPSALLATGLIKAFLDTRERHTRAKDVIYLGFRIGIREDLSHVTLNHEPLQEFFRVTFLRKGVSSETLTSNDLPSLICIYSPLEPVRIVRQANPFLIAIDCADRIDIPWLSEMIKYAQINNIPIIAWSYNPLSNVRSDFYSTSAMTFIWPQSFLYGYEDSKILSEDDPIALFASQACLNVYPCELTGKNVDYYSDVLGRAQCALSQASHKINGRMSRDAVLMGYRLLRLLERLTVSLSTYELERTHYWRQPSLMELCNGLSRFADALKSQDISVPLQEACGHIETAVEWLKSNEPPLWSALVDLCIEDRDSEEHRMLVFVSNAYKSMFAHSLLANENASEKDLQDMGIRLSSITDLTRSINKETPLINTESASSMSSDRPCIPFLIGIPYGYGFGKIAPAIELGKISGKIEILYYPHQTHQLKRFANLLDITLTPDWAGAIRTIQALGARTSASAPPSQRSRIVKIHPLRSIQGRPRPRKEILDTYRPLNIGTPTDELTRLLAQYENIDDAQCIAISPEETAIINTTEETSEFCEHAVKIRFVGGWCALFGHNDTINFVCPNNGIKPRYARAARQGDRILYIHGESRQSLYELLLSRVHTHPSIRAHVEYIRAWQQEVRDKVSAYLRRGHTLDDLHAEMVSRGSTIQTSAAVYCWAKGLVMRPRDPEDLRRLSEILDMPFTRQCYKLIHRAGDRIHGLHIQLSQRLKAWILKGAEGDHMRDEVIDQDLQLTFGDVQDALLLLEVEDVEEVQGLYYKGTLGHLEKECNS